VDGREILLPLGEGDEFFSFCDQRMTPCSMSIMGIDPATGLKLKLSVVTPFRPRDAAFSTIPVLGMRLELSAIAGPFRWEERKTTPVAAEVFIEFGGPDVRAERLDDHQLALFFNSTRASTEERDREAPWQPAEDLTESLIQNRTVLPQTDRIVGRNVAVDGRGFTKRVPANGSGFDLAWCAHNDAVLSVRGERCPFRYARRFKDLDAVAAWAMENMETLFENAKHVDGIIAKNNGAPSLQHLLAYTLHSWLMGTWWVDRAAGEWFSVWEGNCYFHSTVDVEFTQSPFYLSVWPELLGIELDNWPEFSKDGRRCLGSAGEGTLFLSHDTGSHASACGQDYQHEMEVEETVNYVILGYCHYKRTGDLSIMRRHGEVLQKYLAFLRQAGNAASGVPVKGVANTIDDASPAVQFGRGQIYLAVKTLAAFLCGAALMEKLGHPALAKDCRGVGARIRKEIEEKGWQDDHFVTLLDASGVGLTDPWSGKPLTDAVVRGWDAAHIYTVNGIAPLDMVGMDLGIDRGRIVRDLEVATARCMGTYGCAHSDYVEKCAQGGAGFSSGGGRRGWIAMNMLRDIAAFYRGVDLRDMTERYWEWQVTANTQEMKMFFETFGGNNLCFYPRGVAIWGFLEALAGAVIDVPDRVKKVSTPFMKVAMPCLFEADWGSGQCLIFVNTQANA
jgi:hypothetical protein